MTAMVIREIRPITKKKFQIVTDGQLAFVLYGGELSRYRLQEGGELTETVYREICTEILVKRARRRALHLLTARDLTEKQLLEKLRRDGHPQEIAEDALEYVRGYHYVDDARYADSYVRAMQGKKSRKSIGFELERRGVPREIVCQVLEEAGEGSEAEMIRALITKRAGEPHPMEAAELRRVYAYLLRRGFESGEITRELERYQRAE